MSGLDKMLEGTGKLIETIPDIYEDAIKPTAQESGKTMAIIPRAINAALVPLQRWIMHQEYSLEETKKLLAKKLEKVGAEKIVSPEAYVAIPAIQAISYSMDSEVLRNMYANLLAKAMRVDVKENVHPSFVEIIKQMSPRDALIFHEIMKSDVAPIIDLYIKVGSGMENMVYNITWITEYSYSDVSVSIDNIKRMGLIEIPSDRWYSDEKYYDRIRSTSIYKNIEKQLEEKRNGEIGEHKGFIKATELAKKFLAVCIDD